MVIIFCGIPGSGKTTVAKRVTKRLRKYGSAKLFISDELTPPVYKKFFRLLSEHLGTHDFLVFDATFYKKAWREKMRRIAKGHTFCVVYAQCRLPVAIQRNKKRRAGLRHAEAGIPEKAVHIMAARFEEPTYPDVVIDTEKMSISESVKKIMRHVVRNFKARRSDRTNVADRQY